MSVGAPTLTDPRAMGCGQSKVDLKAAGDFSSLGSPPRKQRQGIVRIDKDAHKAIPLLMALDDKLEAPTSISHEC